jgi:hypothetical protein
MSESIWTKAVSSRMPPKVEVQARALAHVEGVTISRWICKLVEREIRRQATESDRAA